MDILLSGGFCFQVERSVSLPCHGKQRLPPSCPHAGKPGQHHWSVVSSLTSPVTLRKGRNNCCRLPLKMEMTVLNLFVNIRYEWRWCCAPIKTKSLGMAWDRVSFQHSLGRKRCRIACHWMTGTHLRSALLGNPIVLQTPESILTETTVSMTPTGNAIMGPFQSAQTTY